MVGVATACAAGVLISSGMGLVVGSVLPLGSLIITLCLGHLVCVVVRPSPRLSLIAGLLGMVCVSALTAGIICHAGLRLGRPLIDDWLAAADRALGLDTPGMVLAFARHPALCAMLNHFYASAMPMILVTITWLSLTGRIERGWRLGFGFVFCITLSAVIYAAFPAIGCLIHAGIAPLVVDGLPPDAGVYHVPTFNAYRFGTATAFDANHMSGLVVFPSFHTAMALLVADAFRRMGPVSWIVNLWAAAVLVSTIPIGGHYVIDVVGGGFVWGLAALISRSRVAEAQAGIQAEPAIALILPG